MSAPDSGKPDTDERTREAIAHLQRASLEFIEAARAVLDVAEEAVREPAGVMAILAETLGGLAGVVGGVAPWGDRGSAEPAAGRPQEARDPSGARGKAVAPDASAARPSSSPSPGRRPRPGVEHIRIS